MTEETLTSSLYDEMLNRLQELEDLAISNLGPIDTPEKEAELNYIESKYSILRITSTYGALMSVMSVYDGFTHAFLQSSDNRRKFLTETTTKIYVAEDNAELFGTVIDESDPDFENKHFPKWVEWRGCFMRIPKNSYITASPTATWPSIFMKSRDKNNYNEITIHERSWNADVYASEENLVKRIQEDELEPLGKGVSRVTIELDDEGNTKYKTVDLEVQKKLEEYDIVLEMPFQAPYRDVLTKVNFKDSKNNPEILLTLALT